MVVLNLKTYVESTGSALDKLLDALRQIKETNPEMVELIMAAPSSIELIAAKKAYPELNIVAQHVDNKNAGSTTGWITPESLIANGVTIAIYNHSEHRVWSDTIVEDIKAIQAKGVKLIVCCENVEEANKLLEAEPFAIAYEPKDLIGSGVSVTTRPEAVQAFIEATKGKTKVLIGAGVSTTEDVAKGLELGADGFLLASAFVKASDPEAKARELVGPYFK